MQMVGDFTYEGLTNRVIKIMPPLLTDSYCADTKVALVSLYKLVYRDRLRAEMPPGEWLEKASKLFCDSISEGLKAAEKPGIQ